MSRCRNCLLVTNKTNISLDVCLGLHPAIFIKKVCLIFAGYSLHVISMWQRRFLISLMVMSRKSNYSFDDLRLSENQVIPFDSLNLFQYIKSTFHLATAMAVLVDNYFSFLSVMNFKTGVECIQLWHAAGAVKKFGMSSCAVNERNH